MVSMVYKNHNISSFHQFLFFKFVYIFSWIIKKMKIQNKPLFKLILTDKYTSDVYYCNKKDLDCEFFFRFY